jgi:hypothetical protein
MKILLPTARMLALPILLAFSQLAAAATGEELVRPIQEQWAEIKYRQPEKQQADSYRTLAAQAHRSSKPTPACPSR